jgi:hypothetical protein
MENFSYHVPFYVVTNGVATSGHSSDLAGGQVGLFDRQNFSVATAAGLAKELFLSQGTIGGKGWYGEPVTESHKSPFFLAKDVKNLYKSLPARIQNEEWIVGYDGSQSSKSLEFVAGLPTRIKMYFHGEPIYRMFNAPKEYVVSYTPPVACTTDCASSCDADRKDPKPHAIKLIDQINTHPELKKLGVRAMLVEDTFVAASATKEQYKLQIFDEGTGVSLAQVKAQYPGKDISSPVGSRDGVLSTYILRQPVADSAPAAFQYKGGYIALAVCGTCPSGWTLQPGSSTYYISRPLAGTEDLNDDTARQAFANAVKANYAAVDTFDGATGVGSNQITVTAHGLTTGDAVVYSNGGGTSVVGLTSGNTYYVVVIDANTVKLASTYANAVAASPTTLTITDGVGAAHTLTVAGTATYVGQDGAVAKVKLVVAPTVTLTAYNADEIELEGTVGDLCVAPAGSTQAWVADGTGVSGTRTLKIKLKRPDCDADGDRIEDITAALTGITGVNIGTLTKIAGDACVDEYTVTQSSDDYLDESCLTGNVSFTYGTPLPLIDGQAWEVLDPTITPDDDRKVGIKISAGYYDPKFGNCSFDPTDYYENMPIKMEVTGLIENADNCKYGAAPTSFQTKIARIARQTGEWVVREVLMKTDAYLKHVDQWDSNPRMREAFDMQLLNTVDRNAFYTLWYISFDASYNATSRKGLKEAFTAVVAFKEGDPALVDFETRVIDVLSAKSDIVPHVNS